MDRTAEELLSRYADLLHAHGPGSPQARAFRDAHRGRAELRALELVCELLRREAAGDVRPCPRCGRPAAPPAVGAGVGGAHEQGRVPLCTDCLAPLATD